MYRSGALTLNAIPPISLPIPTRPCDYARLASSACAIAAVLPGASAPRPSHFPSLAAPPGHAPLAPFFPPLGRCVGSCLLACRTPSGGCSPHAPVPGSTRASLAACLRRRSSPPFTRRGVNPALGRMRPLIGGPGGTPPPVAAVSALPAGGLLSGRAARLYGRRAITKGYLLDICFGRVFLRLGALPACFRLSIMSEAQRERDPKKPKKEPRSP